jgi:hypothetical protein
MQGGCENFLSGASDHCTSTRRERRRKIFCKADAGDFLNLVLNYYNCGLPVRAIMHLPKRSLGNVSK